MAVCVCRQQGHRGHERQWVLMSRVRSARRREHLGWNFGLAEANGEEFRHDSVVICYEDISSPRALSSAF